MQPGFIRRLWESQLARLRTPRGVVTSICTAFIILLITSVSTTPGATLLTLVILLPAFWWMTWAFMGVPAAWLTRVVYGRVPSVRVGRQWQSSGSGRSQLRVDTNGSFFETRGGILLKRRLWFVASGTPVFEVAWAEWEQLAEAQWTDPVYVRSHRDRDYWWYQDTIYWTNTDYSPDDIKALVFARERRSQRELEHAHAVLASSAEPRQRKRKAIPKDVKLAVWERDEGRCVECGSDFDIQYDHEIPLSMGGASTVDNLQLLCAKCNQEKGGRL